MHTPHAFRPILFDESSLITRLESQGLRKTLTIMGLPCNGTGVNCEGERSLHRGCVSYPCHFPACAGSTCLASPLRWQAVQLSTWETNLQFPGVFQKEFERSSACLQVSQSHHSDRSWTAATLKGKPLHQKQERGRCHKQTWAKGSLWFSHEKVIRGVRALEYPSRHFLGGLQLQKARGSAANVCRISVSSSCHRSLITSRAPTLRQAKAGLSEGNWCHHARVQPNLKNR